MLKNGIRWWAVTLAAALAPAAGATTDVDLELVNRALAGNRAQIELVGEVEPVIDARAVTVGPETTSWRTRAGEHRVATDRVERITLTGKSRSLRWMRRGLAIGAGVGLLGGLGYSESDGWFRESPDAGDLVTGAAVGGSLGAAAGALRGDVVVYERSP